MLADDKLVSQEIAVLRLIDISEKNKIYNDTIKFAFIKRMKAPYKEAKEAAKKSQMKTAKLIIKAFQQVERRTYAQYIFRWLGKEYNKGELDLVNLDLSCQDFRAKDNKGHKIKHFRAKKGNYFVLDSVNLTGAKLKGVDLTEADLTGVKLVAANLQYSILKKADLTEADLNGADLTGADLNGANLSKIDLENVILGEDMLMLESKIFDNKGEEKVKLIEKINRKENFTNKEKRIYGQLIDVKSLHETTGIPERVDQQLKQDKPELFKPPKEEQNET